MSAYQASVIIPLWNGVADVPACLDALLAQEGVAFETLVVDNGSEDGGGDLIAERYPAVRLLRQPRNLGFSGGCNVGLRAAQGDVRVLLNVDTEVRPGWLAALVEAVAEPGVGIAGSKCLYPDGTIQHAGGSVSARGSGSHPGRLKPDDGRFDTPADVDFVTGASLAISPEAFAAVGLLDEAGFSPIYYEDVDWCYRVRRAGFRVRYEPRSVLVHKEASVRAGPGHEAMYLQHRHRLRLVLKHWSLEDLCHAFLPAERAWLAGLGEGSEGLVAAMRRAYLHHLLHLAGVMPYRQRWGASAEEAADLAQVLLTLRQELPLADLGSAEAAARERALFDALREGWRVEEQPFRSGVPVIGPLIAGFRALWSRVATVWYVRPLVEQQVRFNGRVLDALERLRATQGRTRDVLAEYVAENGRELDELAQEVRRLRALLDDEEA